jgi:hypothetical protein
LRGKQWIFINLLVSLLIEKYAQVYVSAMILMNLLMLFLDLISPFCIFLDYLMCKPAMFLVQVLLRPFVAAMARRCISNKDMACDRLGLRQ